MTAVSNTGPLIALAKVDKLSLLEKLFIDERLGRTAARRLGLTITGVIGVLIRAKEAELIQAVCPLLNEARQQGYWLSDEALNVAAKLAGEDEIS